MAIVGIDLGTTNSLISIFKDGRPTLVSNSQGSVLTPSAVAVDEDGSIIVGAAAREIAVTRPDEATYSFKRWIGTEKVVTLRGKPFRDSKLIGINVFNPRAAVIPKRPALIIGHQLDGGFRHEALSN